MSDKPVKPEDTTGGKVIRGAAAGLGVLLTWLWYRKKSGQPPPPGCNSGCVKLLIFGFIIWVLFLFILGLVFE